ncbi:MAG: PKD domain-containing protein [Bacteroidia bacterium]|nr:PKD domain-containing protein [Bacteroidia bacterium]
MRIYLHAILFFFLSIALNSVAQPGVYTSNGGCGAHTPALTSSIKPTGGNTIICVSSTPAGVSLTTSSSVGAVIVPGNNIKYLIYTEYSLSNSGFIEPGNPLPTVFNPTVPNYNQITYSLVLVDTSIANGCRDSSWVTMQLTPSLNGGNLTLSALDADGDNVYCPIPGDPLAGSDPINFKPQFNLPAGTDLTGYTFNFNMGNGTTFTRTDTSTFVFTYATQGIYNVVMTTLSPGGCSGKDSVKITYITANNLTIATISGSPTRFCVPQSIQPTLAAGSFFDSYVWNFGDNTPNVTTTTPTVPPHNYADSGKFVITVGGVNECAVGESDSYNVIEGIKGAKAYFTNKNGAGVSTLLGCEPLVMTFKDSSKFVPKNWGLSNAVMAAAPYNNPGPYYVRWNFGNGNTQDITTKNVSHDPSSPQTYSAGVYTVELIAYSFCGRDTIRKQLIVNKPPVANFTYTTNGICSPVLVSSILNTSTDVGYAPTYAWTLSGTNIGTTLNVANQTLTTTGSTLVNAPLKLVVTNNCGNSQKTNIISANPAVSPNFTLSTNAICVGQSLTVTNSSQGTGLSYSWNYGGSTTPTSNAVNSPSTQTYNTVGKDTVRLTLTGACGTAKYKLPIVVKQYPRADVTSADTVICPGANAKFTNVTNGGALCGTCIYSWVNGASSNPSTSTNPVSEIIQYSGSGIAYVKLTIDSIGCKTTDSIMVRVNPRPYTSIAASNVSVCSPDTVTFVNNSVLNMGDTYYWDYGNGVTSTVFNPQITPPLIYKSFDDSIVVAYFKISSGTSGCVDSNKVTINIHPVPKTSFTNSDTLCNGNELSFTNTTPTNLTGTLQYAWDFGDGVASVDINPKHIYSTLLASEKFKIKAKSTSQFGCIHTYTDSVVVLAIPVPMFNFPTVCQQDSTNFDASPSIGATNYVWNFGEPSTGLSNKSTLTAPKHLYTTDGIFTVKLIAKNSFGCSDSLSQTVKVNPKPVANFTNGGGTCAKTRIVFDDVSSTSITNWSWNFDDPASGANNSATTNSPSHIYPNPTNVPFKVTLIVTNNYGCKDTVKKAILIYPKPIADFTFDTACAYKDMHFYTRSQVFPPVGGGLNFALYVWTFGDGNGAIFNQNPTYVYQNDTGFTVMLAIQDLYKCKDTIFKRVLVRTSPKAGFILDTVCLGLPTNFTDTITTNNLATTEWFWTFGNGDTSTLQNPQHQYTNAGFFSTKLITKDKLSGCSSEDVHTVRVLDIARPSFISQDTICEGVPVQYQNFSTATSGAIISGYVWHFGDNTYSTATNPAHTFDSSGVFIDTLFVTTTTGCNAFYLDTILVNPQPIANFGATNLCDKNKTQFTDSTKIKSGQTLNWLWSFGDGGSSSLENPTHTYSSPTVYNVTFTTESDKGCRSTIKKKITIHPNPVASFTTNLACLTDSTRFTNTSSISVGSTIVKNYWNFDDATKDSLVTNFNHLFNLVNDTFNVQLIVISDQGCKDTLVQKVNLLPIVKFNIDALNAEGCQPYNAMFVDSSTIRSPSTISNWKWVFDDGDISLETNPKHVYVRDGTYNVSLNVITSDGCKFTQAMQYPVIVHPHPIANFNNDYYETDVTNASMTFANSSANSVHYLWNFGDGTTSTQINPSHIFPDSGTYIVQLNVADNFGCIDSTIKTIRVNGIYSLYVPNSFTPNHDGVNDVFRAYGYGISNYKLEIFTRWGDKVFSANKLLDAWDGKNDDGIDAPLDTYIYRISIDRFDELKPKLYTGNVTLVR